MFHNETKKMRSRSESGSLNNMPVTDSMKSSVPVLLLVLALTSGCSLFHFMSKKTTPPVLPPAVGVQVEFHDRWMDKRFRELLAAGSAKTEEEARATAEAEFAKQYPFVKVPEKGQHR